MHKQNRLTKEQYFSLDADKEYFSRSQYLGFLACEERELERINGNWVEEKTEALLVGSYVHAWNEGTLEVFKKENPEVFTQKGELRANFKVAEKMIATLEKDHFAMYVLSGDKEVVMTGEFAGAQWKVMLDSYLSEKRRKVDLKTSRGINGTFIENYRYMLQAALYSEIERVDTDSDEGDFGEFYIVAVSKEDEPDKAVINLTDHNRFVTELATIELAMPRMIKVKAGLEPPVRCEKCAYCRSTKKLTKAIYYLDLGSDTDSV